MDDPEEPLPFGAAHLCEEYVQDAEDGVRRPLRRREEILVAKGLPVNVDQEATTMFTADVLAVKEEEYRPEGQGRSRQKGAARA